MVRRGHTVNQINKVRLFELLRLMWPLISEGTTSAVVRICGPNAAHVLIIDFETRQQYLVCKKSSGVWGGFLQP